MVPFMVTDRFGFLSRTAPIRVRYVSDVFCHLEGRLNTREDFLVQPVFLSIYRLRLIHLRSC